MKKLILLLFTILCIAGTASPQTPEKSKTLALNFFQERLDIHSAENRASADIDNFLPLEIQGSLRAFAVNFKGGGYVLVSVSDNTFPVLGYSMKGSFTGEDPPPALMAWLRYYGRQMDAVSGLTQPAPEIKKMRERYSNRQATDAHSTQDVVEPLLRTVWDQGNYYNGMCPPDPAGPGGRCYAGCVATAVGQLMFYHRWPQQGTGEYSYVHPDYGVQYANYGETTYQWNGMERTLNGPNEHIALLLYHLGISFDMDYGPGGSGMWNHSAANSMRAFFKYGAQTQYIFRDTTTMNWDSILIANLEARKPLYYAGWESVGSQNGHAFVCDGYSPDGFYHFNWGWSGSYDGYFLLSALTPGGSNFNFAQEVIKDIYPDTTLYNYPGYCQGPDTLSFIAGSFTDGSNMPDYPSGSTCQWLIRPQDSDYDSISGLQLLFPLIDLADGDSLHIYRGDDTAQLLASYSGSMLPEALDIPASSALVLLSGENGGGNGFLGFYKSLLPVYCSGTTTFNTPSGSFEDGSGEYNYGNNSMCKWRIIPSELIPLKLTFEQFNLQEGFDFLRIYDLSSQQEIALLTGSTVPDPVIVPGGKAYLIFTSDGIGTAPGFTLNWAPEGNTLAGNKRSSPARLFPNPAKESVWIEFETTDAPQRTLEVYTLSGQKTGIRETIRTGQTTVRLGIKNLDPGFYLIRISSSTGISWMNLIKE